MVIDRSNMHLNKNNPTTCEQECTIELNIPTSVSGHIVMNFYVHGYRDLL